MKRQLLLGCIADDFTGATDLANNLVRSGMRVLQTMGVPSAPIEADVDAVVVALKSRTLPPGVAVAQSLEALLWLQAQVAKPQALQIYFKYCSTFDSVFTPAVQGNIGAVTEALMAALNTDFTIATPAFPDNGRTVFKGHLFVGDALLSESGMQNHPITPMTDANLVRVLQAQTQHRVGLIDHRTVASPVATIRKRIDELRSQGSGMAVVDALSNPDLMRLGKALKGMPLVTAGSGVAIGLPQNFGISPSNTASQLPAPCGLQAIVSGSCSLASNAQVAHFIASGNPALALDPLDIAEKQTSGVDAVVAALAWAKNQLLEPLDGASASPILIYATADTASVKAVQAQLGVAEAGELVENTLSRIAAGLLALGVRQLIVAGGETSGACVQALGIVQMQIGPQIDPGVPWCYGQTQANAHLHIALKSGNFGTADFFSKAFVLLQPNNQANNDEP
jgi:3-dehydrotetronate 4-kinase